MAGFDRGVGKVYKDLRDFLGQLEEKGDLRVFENVDWNEEIGGISELMAERGGPACLFDKIKGYPIGYRVVTNLMATVERFALALGFPADTQDNLDFVKAWRARFKAPELIPPVEVKKGDFVTFPKGMSCTWKITKDIRKHYTFL